MKIYFARHFHFWVDPLFEYEDDPKIEENLKIEEPKNKGILKNYSFNNLGLLCFQNKQKTAKACILELFSI